MRKAMTWILLSLLAVSVVPVWAQRGAGQANQGQNDPATCPNAAALAALQPLSQEEAASLAYMREEEKLARDVYLALYERWGLSAFGQISQSEQRHFDALGKAIARYDVSDPAANATAGVFSTPKFLAMYADLVGQGSASILEALRVGAVIEEIDIIDLEETLVVTDNADIERVYTNLLLGSHNHLRAFVSHLQVLGVEYAPQYLGQDAFDAIINSETANGNGKAGRFGNFRKK